MIDGGEFNLSTALDLAYAHLANALFYADLLARQAHEVQPSLGGEPEQRTLGALEFRTNNNEVVEQVRTQFADEITRYALIFAMAHYDRFVFDLGVLEAIAAAFSSGGGRATLEAIQAAESDARKIEFGRSVARELKKLAASAGTDVAIGIGWFEGLYGIRNCLVHRAGIVAAEDRNLIAGITWRRLSLAVDGNELTGALPKLVEKGGEIQIRFTDSTRAWALGEPIRLTLEEIHEMMWSLNQLAVMLIHYLNGEFQHIKVEGDITE
jgi:hypothetical protein